SEFPMFRARASVRKLASALIVGLALLPGLAIEQELQLDYRINEHIVLVPAGRDHQARLETTVFQPNGPGPFPLIIINHGKDPGHPNLQPRDRFYHMAHAFVARGYAVMVPMRQGFANSTGKYHDQGCGWRSSLVSAFAEYGSQNKIPSLWMYGQNDSLFGPELVARMHDAFEQAGGKAQLVEYAAFKRDSHGMLASRDGEKVRLADTM